MVGIPVELVGEGIDWPAWVQAVGSIAAIISGFAVVATQERAKARERAKQTERIAVWGLELASRAAWHLGKVPKLLESAVADKIKNPKLTIQLGNHELELVDTLYGRLDLMALPHEDLSGEAINMMRLVRVAIADVGAAENNINTVKDCAPQLEAVRGFAVAARASSEHYRAALEKHGIDWRAAHNWSSKTDDAGV